MKVYLQNFRCFKEKTVEFPNGNISLLKGESGRGKTTILQSCFWCLFGNLRNIYPLDFKPSSTNQTIVTLEFPKSKLRYITRSQPPEQVKIYIKKDNSESKDSSESEFEVLESEAAQRYIESVFGSKDIWFVSSYLAQGERSPLMTNSNSDKMNLLCEILFGNKFNSDIENYQNPDWYSSKIEQELSNVSSELTLQTNLYNTNYSKYIEAHNNYKPPTDNDCVWSKVPNLEELDDIVSEISNLKVSISDITKKMLSLKGLEKEKELLDQRIVELNAKIKAFESMNSEDVVLYLQKTKEEIKDLESTIDDLNTIYLTTLANEQKQEFLQSKIAELDQKIQNLSLTDDIIKDNLENMKINIKSKKEEISKYNQNLMDIQLKETEKENLVQKLDKINIDLTDVKEKLNNFSIKDTEYLRKLIHNTKSFQKLKDIQDKEPENVTSLYQDSELVNIQINIPGFVKDYKSNQKICLKHNLINSESDEITEVVETKLKTNLEKIKKMLDFVDIMKVELELKEKHDILDHKIDSIKISLDSLKNQLIEDERFLEKSDPILNLETYITIKTEIQMNTGDCMVCPDCNSSLEIKSEPEGPKLCKLTRKRYSKDESKKYIETINKLSENIKIFKSKESELEYLKKQKESLEEPKAEYITEQAIKKYTPDFISKYTTYYEDFLKFKFNLTNEYNLSYIEACQLLENIPKIRKRNDWEKEFSQAKSNLSIDSSLPLLNSIEIKNYESNIIEIPILQSKSESLQASEKEYNETLELIDKFLENQESSSTLKENIENLKQEVEKLIQEAKNKIVYNETIENLNKLKSDLNSVILSTGASSKEIKNKIEDYKSKVQNLKETLSGYSQFEVLTTELNSNESKIKEVKKSIKSISTFNSEELSIQLENINQNINKKETYHKSGKDLRDLASLRSSIEEAQKEALVLATEQSYLNRLKILITEVTNSSLQNLVDSINSCTNSILEDLFENDIKVELKLFKEHKKTNSLKPQVNFTIFYNNNVYDNIMGLSGGEKDRISLALTIALACVNPSPVLFLDECMSSLNTDLRENCVDVIKKFVISQTGKTVINIEHSGIEGYYDNIISI
jgi:DNA repair exonuclease SbcCD ATPase subunit